MAPYINQWRSLYYQETFVHVTLPALEDPPVVLFKCLENCADAIFVGEMSRILAPVSTLRGVTYVTLEGRGQK